MNNKQNEIKITISKELVPCKPAEANSSPLHGAGVNVQYALHIWDSQEESHPSQYQKQT